MVKSQQKPAFADFYVIFKKVTEQLLTFLEVL